MWVDTVCHLQPILLYAVLLADLRETRSAVGSCTSRTCTGAFQGALNGVLDATDTSLCMAHVGTVSL